MRCKPIFEVALVAFFASGATPAVAAAQPYFIPLGASMQAPRGFVEMCSAGDEEDCAPVVSAAAAAPSDVQSLVVPASSDTQSWVTFPVPLRTALAGLAGARDFSIVDTGPVGPDFQLDAQRWAFGTMAPWFRSNEVKPPIDRFGTRGEAWLSPARRADEVSFATDTAEDRPDGEAMQPVAWAENQAPVDTARTPVILVVANPSSPLAAETRAPTAAVAPAASAGSADAISQSAFAAVREINRRVNDRVVQQSDLETTGQEDLWRRAGAGRGATGDCEDIALEKHHELIAAGVSPRSMFLAVVFAPRLGLHTVLMVRTAEGDVVLDSLTSQIRTWDKVHYSWVSIQSSTDPMNWHALRREA